MCPVELSGVDAVLADGRYRLQYDLWHKYEPPLAILLSPTVGPVGSTRAPPTWWLLLNQSEHHSHTFPETLCRPYPFGSKAVTGAVPAWPSSTVLTSGKSPCQTLLICRPSGVNSSPQGKSACSSPPRAANSHSASVGRRLPAQAANAAASFHDTWTTG